MSDQAVFVPRDGRFVASELARGPWDPDAQHGGAPAALLMRAFEALNPDDGLVLARVTYEFLRPVPLRPVDVRAVLARPGRRVQLLEGSIVNPDGDEVVRARALRVRAADATAAGAANDRTGGATAMATPAPEATGSATPAPPASGPEQGRELEFRPPYRPMFAPDAIEIRFVSGGFGGGPATAWFRFHAPLVAGEAPSPLQTLAAAGDFGNGISATLSWDHYLFINPDLTLYIDREPVGEWICLQSETRITPEGVGNAESIIYDRRGRVGRATQALLVAAR